MERIESEIVDDITNNLHGFGTQNNINPEFIPYACYYDEQTILTQNGEMLQTIKIPSFVSNTGTANFYLLRENLNKSFINNAKNQNLNFWFQVVRKPVDIVPKNQQYNNYISRMLMDRWNKHYNWNNQFANEIYITIVLVSEAGKVSKTFEFISAISFSMLVRSRTKDFAKMNAIITEVSNGILNDMKDYGARILKVKKKDDIYYSEHLKFFSSIINCEFNDIKLPINELSESLLFKKVAYGKNLMQIYDKNRSTYSAMVSLKYCNLLLLSQLDKIIQLDYELVITQSVSFIDSKPVNEEMMKYFEILSINEDPSALNLSDIGSMMPNAEEEKNKICASQLVIQVKAETKEELNKNVEKLFNTISKLGLVAIREEMFMPTIFWSQLPGNFNFVKRVHKISQENVCAFVSLFNFPTGKLTNNLWGDTAIVLKSTLGTPYFFSFDSGKNPNTLFIGPKSLKKTKYMNFLLMATTKQVKRIFYIDNTNRSRIFINSLGGKYYSISKEDSDHKIQINPFSVEKNSRGVEFILNWLLCILQRTDDGMIHIDESSTKLSQELEKLKVLVRDNIEKITKIGDLLKMAKKEKLTNVCSSLSKWTSVDKYGFIFNNVATLDLFSSDIVGINLNAIVNNEELKTAIFDYIVHSIIEKADGSPSILAIDEGWLLFDNPYFAPRISKVLRSLYNRNVAVIMTTSGADSYEVSSIKLSVKNIFPTQILLPNVKATIYQRKIFDIAEEESRVLSVMKEENGNFLLKHSGNIVVSSLDFSFLTKGETHIFSSHNLYFNMMTKAKELAESDKPEDWLPIMFRLIKEHEKVKQEEKLMEREKRQIQWEEAKQKRNEKF
ncbi:MAG: hypothetical protein LBB13_02785 [Rickettsiales bacterium]|jgi:type IV secretion system protein VirB4|nr:hypothetical protein [Rickettsiales bacterium]